MASPIALRPVARPCVSVLIAATLAALLPTRPLAAEWLPRLSFMLREGYDDNVHIQDVTPQALKGSWLTTIVPSVGIEHRPDGSKVPAETGSLATVLGASQALDGWRTSLSYAPEMNYYLNVPTENYVRHNLMANFGARQGSWSWGSDNSVTLVDGPTFGPTFTGPGGGPGMGGFPLRDRRDQTLYRHSLAGLYLQDTWFVRPIATAFVQDFHVQHRTTPGYLNYTDRADINGGVDAGVRVLPNTYATLGYRFGHLNQAEVNNVPLEYSNNYQRVLFGLEGQLAPWLSVQIAVGPSFHQFGRHVVDTFDRNQTHFYTDSTIKVKPSADDDLTFRFARFMLPAYAGRNVFDDATYMVTWVHRFNSHWSASLSFKDYNGYFDPALRNESVFTPAASLIWKINAHLTADLSWSLDDAESAYPNTSGREYHRNLVSLGLRYQLN